MRKDRKNTKKNGGGAGGGGGGAPSDTPPRSGEPIASTSHTTPITQGAPIRDPNKKSCTSKESLQNKRYILVEGKKKKNTMKA